MKWIIGSIVLLVAFLGARLVWAKKNNVDPFTGVPYPIDPRTGRPYDLKLGIDPITGQPYPPGSIFASIASGKVGFSVEYPPIPQPGNPKSANGAVSSFCNRIMGANTELIGKVPDKNAKYVQQASNVLTDVNCGAVRILEKGVGAVIVTPAKAVGKLFSKIF